MDDKAREIEWKLQRSREQVEESFSRLEAHFDRAGESFDEVKSTLSGKSLWKNHFWVTAAGSIAVGVLLGRRGMQSSVREVRPADLKRLEERLVQSSEHPRQQPIEGSTTIHRNPGKLERVKALMEDHPTIVPTLVNLGMALIKGASKRSDTQPRPDEQELG